MQACGHTPIWSSERVLRANARERYMYLPAFKRWIVEQAMQPGMSMAGLAVSNQVNANRLRRRAQRHGGHQLAPATPWLLPVTITCELPASTAVFSSVGIIVEIGVSVDEAELLAPSGALDEVVTTSGPAGRNRNRRRVRCALAP